MIFVSKPFLPPIEEYQALLKGVWDRAYLTNEGPLSLELEDKLKNYLGLKNIKYVTSGTTAIQIAIKALNISKEVITTPFSHISTTNSLTWENCKPIFVDIDPNTLNIDPDKIEDKITKNTEAILATHCFGNPCNIEKIDEIAKKYNLKVIYDAAHCFAVKYKNKSIFNYGDISITSFHATKIFHTVEGGAIITKDNKLDKKIELMRNFGQRNPEDFRMMGINGKNSEVHAAMGLCNLKYIKEILNKRKKQAKIYNHSLNNNEIKRPVIANHTEYNYAYYPVIFNDEKTVINVKKELENNNIFPRRYFYPTLNKVTYLNEKPSMPIAEDIAKRILCLPLYHDLKKSEQNKIIRIINGIIK